MVIEKLLTKIVFYSIWQPFNLISVFITKTVFTLQCCSSFWTMDSKVLEEILGLTQLTYSLSLGSSYSGCKCCLLFHGLPRTTAADCTPAPNTPAGWARSQQPLLGPQASRAPPAVHKCVQVARADAVGPTTCLCGHADPEHLLCSQHSVVTLLLEKHKVKDKIMNHFDQWQWYIKPSIRTLLRVGSVL